MGQRVVSDIRYGPYQCFSYEYGDQSQITQYTNDIFKFVDMPQASIVEELNIESQVGIELDSF